MFISFKMLFKITILLLYFIHSSPIWDPNVISKIKQNSSDMNKIILAPCDAFIHSLINWFMPYDIDICPMSYVICHDTYYMTHHICH
jgi:hypothetical protein